MMDTSMSEFERQSLHRIKRDVPDGAAMRQRFKVVITRSRLDGK